MGDVLLAHGSALLARAPARFDSPAGAHIAAPRAARALTKVAPQGGLE
jgi:hypothetical protein